MDKWIDSLPDGRWMNRQFTWNICIPSLSVEWSSVPLIFMSWENDAISNGSELWCDGMFWSCAFWESKSVASFRLIYKVIYTRAIEKCILFELPPILIHRRCSLPLSLCQQSRLEKDLGTKDRKPLCPSWSPRFETSALGTSQGIRFSCRLPLGAHIDQILGSNPLLKKLSIMGRLKTMYPIISDLRTNKPTWNCCSIRLSASIVLHGHRVCGAFDMCRRKFKFLRGLTRR